MQNGAACVKRRRYQIAVSGLAGLGTPVRRAFPDRAL